MAKVFISYSRKDIAFAKRLTTELQKCDLDFWIDWEGIPPTVDWWREIEKGIEESDIYLFLISPDSVKSKVCGQEIDTAVKNGKRIIPIVVRDSNWDETPPQLRHLNYIFIRESDDFDAAVNKLITAVEADYEWAATHRRLQIKALDWERNNKDSGFLLRGADLLDAEQDLATNSSKEPRPTDLQREYVFESRKATDRQRRITTGISIAAAIALAALAAFGFYKAGVARRQTNIALSGKLAAQAEILLDKDLQKALLLGIESNRILEKNSIPTDALTRGVFLDLVNTNLQLFQFLSPNEQTDRIDFSPDGKTLASTNGRRIIFWNIATGKPISNLELADVLKINSIAFHPTGKLIAVGTCIEIDKNGFECNKGEIILWDLETKQQKDQLFVENMTPENKMWFSPDGRSLVSKNTIGNRDAHITVWEIKTGNVFDLPISKDSIVTDITFSLDGKTLAIGDSINHITLWDMEKHRKVKSIGEANDMAGNVFFSPDGKIITSTSIFPPSTEFWDITTGEVLDTFTGGVLIGVNYEANIQLTSNAGKITVWENFWDASNRSEINHIQPDQFAQGLVISPDGRFLAQLSNRGDILLWDTTIPENQGNYQKSQTADDPISKNTSDEYDSVLDISSDGKFFVSDEVEGYAIRDTTTGRLVTKLQTDQLLIDIAVLSHDHKTVATGSCVKYNNSLCIQGEINFWGVETGVRLEQRLKSNFTNITSLAFYPNDQVLAVSDGKLVHLWDLSSHQLTGPSFTADVNEISNLTFSSDGKILAASALARNNIDYVILLWDVNTGEPIGQPLMGYPPLRFSPDRKTLTSADDVGNILLWDMDPQSWITKSCQRAGRNFTRAEWAQYMLDIPYPTAQKDATCPEWPLLPEVISTTNP